MVFLIWVGLHLSFKWWWRGVAMVMDAAIDTKWRSEGGLQYNKCSLETLHKFQIYPGPLTLTYKLPHHGKGVRSWEADNIFNAQGPHSALLKQAKVVGGGCQVFFMGLYSLFTTLCLFLSSVRWYATIWHGYFPQQLQKRWTKSRDIIHFFIYFLHKWNSLLIKSFTGGTINIAARRWLYKITCLLYLWD